MTPREAANDYARRFAIALAPEAPERADCSKGLLSVEMNRALVGCQDNATEIV